ncbi:MAG: magnesium transporter [Clostridia bacterium]|nr:magnesium transporter [Clostridia bacterium]MCI8979745.1 magnesium transporter [Clostridia bacterium]MCI9085705.1 magnesium transporter [Clostridia bacterium]NDO18184.1 magnesium transporter [Lachnospiraceae bacterium MD329]
MESLLNNIDRLLKEKRFSEVKRIVSLENPADLAALFVELFGEDFEEKSEFIILFRLLPKDIAAEVFAYMDGDMRRHLIEMFTDKELREILDELFIDDTVDLIEELPANVVSRILKNSSTGERKAINEILRYPRDSAGSIMTIEYVSLHKDMTVSEAFEKIRRVGVNKETIYTCYVTENRRLIGVITVKDLFLADEDEKLSDIMETNIISVNTHEDQELVGNMFRKYDLLALPVVDRDNRLVGIVTFDDAMDVIQEENTEDFARMAAIAPNEHSYFKTGILRHAGSRIGWLLILMISATLTQIITSRYENAFETIPLLVSFMPMIMDTGGNCGSQSSTMIIRCIALDEIHFSDFFKVVFKEFRISILVCSVLAVVNGIRVYVMYEQNILLAVTIALSIVVTVIISKIIGSSLPLLAKRCKLDPAIMATPLITTIVDCCSLFLYFNIATIIFNI